LQKNGEFADSPFLLKIICKCNSYCISLKQKL
jgi:hypothetical protein